MAKFEKGNKLGKGRPLGARNIVPLARKDELEALFNEHGGFEVLFTTIGAIEEPKDKANALLKVMEFFMAKHKSIDVTGDSINNIAKVFFAPLDVPPITSESDVVDDF